MQTGLLGVCVSDRDCEWFVVRTNEAGLPNPERDLVIWQDENYNANNVDESILCLKLYIKLAKCEESDTRVHKVM